MQLSSILVIVTTLYRAPLCGLCEKGDDGYTTVPESGVGIALANWYRCIDVAYTRYRYGWINGPR